jgi:predicted Zn-dependent protease with MMP-like domain
VLAPDRLPGILAAMTQEEFRLVALRALKGLPEEFREYATDCLLVVRKRPSRKLLREMEVPEDEGLYGLYEGAALTERHHDDMASLPPRITLFYEPLLEDCETEEELIHEIQMTVLHELGHHFGLDEDRLAELGYE